MAVEETSGLMAWVIGNGQVVYFFSQLAYWLFMAFFAGWAACSLFRWVNFATGWDAARAAKKAEKDGTPATTPAAPAADSKIDVEKFVD